MMRRLNFDIDQSAINIDKTEEYAWCSKAKNYDAIESYQMRFSSCSDIFENFMELNTLIISKCFFRKII